MRLIAAVLLWITLSPAQIVPGRYILELTAEPLGALARSGGNAQLKARRIDTLEAQQRSVRRAVEAGGGRVLGAMNAVMNGVIVSAPRADQAALRAIPGVARVYPVRRVKLYLDHALPLHYTRDAWAAAGGMERAGGGVKIGIVDTGITPAHPAFRDPALRPPAGYPMASSEANLALTSGKIVVARSYEELYELEEPHDARDHNGHGTAVAMCAAGFPNDGPYGAIAGVAPKAHLGVYKVFPLPNSGASTEVIAKALDDALADRMDVVNMSLGSDMVIPQEEDIIAISVERLTRFGVVVVVAAGNAGPDLATVGDTGSIPSAISVGASSPDRTLGGAVYLDGAEPLRAWPDQSPSSDPVTAPVADLPSDACEAAPAPLDGKIALAVVGPCSHARQIDNIRNAGAAAAILYPASESAYLGRLLTTASLPAVMVAPGSAAAIKDALARRPGASARIAFNGVSYPYDAANLLSFSSRGPTYNYQIKPDLAATGYVYTATQSLDDVGDLFNRGGYMIMNGTSFSSPIVAGAAAVLRAARPGLSVDHYRSLLINSAAGLNLKAGYTERVQQTGSGVLHLAGAVRSTISVYPTSLSFGIGSGALAGTYQLTVTNLGAAADTFTLTAIPYDDAPPLTFYDLSNPSAPTKVASLRIEPGQSKTIYPSWEFDDPAPGEYQGQIWIRDTRTGSTALVPYWCAVPSGIVNAATLVYLPEQLTVGGMGSIYFRVIDSSGIAITDRPSLRFNGRPVAGGGALSDVYTSVSYPGLVYVRVKMGPEPGPNTFRIGFGGLRQVDYTIEAVEPRDDDEEEEVKLEP